MFNTLDIEMNKAAEEEAGGYFPSILIGTNTRKKPGTVAHVCNTLKRLM